MLDGDIIEVAANKDDFAYNAQLVIKQDELFLAGLVERMISDGKLLAEGECYAFQLPPILGAPTDISNVTRMYLAVYNSVSASLHKHLYDHPGQAISRLRGRRSGLTSPATSHFIRPPGVAPEADLTRIVGFTGPPNRALKPTAPFVTCLAGVF